jgi:hypothetical protein
MSTQDDEKAAEKYANNSGEDGDSDAVRRVKECFIAGRLSLRPEIEKRDQRIKELTKIANQNAESCKGLSEEIDRLRAAASGKGESK